MLLILIIVLLLCGGGFGSYYGHTNWGPAFGPGIGIGTILLVLLVFFLLQGRL